MNNTVKNVFAFLAGAAIGVGATWKIFKTKYKNIADEEIADVKEKFEMASKKKTSLEVKPREEAPLIDEKEEYKSVVAGVGYDPVNMNSDIKKKDISVISPDLFGELEDYGTCSLTYYADGILADDCDEVVEDVDGWVGLDSLGCFGEYEDDAVHVRNNRLKIDFEILRSMKKFSEVVPKSSRPVNIDQCMEE